MDRILATHKPDAIMHLAAESHVDRSIDGPGDLRRHQCDGDLHAFGGRTVKYWTRERASPRVSAFTISRPTRSMARCRAIRPCNSPKTRGYDPQQPLFRVEGRVRPPGPRLGARPTGCRSF